MVLKQRILKEEIIKLLLSLIGITIPFLAIGFLVITNKDTVQLFLVFILVLYLPVFLLGLLLGALQLEWYFIYTDRIEAKGIFGVKNTVYFQDVLFVERTEIPLTNRGMYKTFFIFQDGRKNNENFLGRNSCYNRKKYNFRIYMTPELEKYITKTLQMEIRYR